MLVYEAHYPHIFQAQASNPASMFPFIVVDDVKQQIRHIIRRIITQHPERRRLDFTARHFTTVAQDFMLTYLRVRYVFAAFIPTLTSIWLYFQPLSKRR